MIANINYRGQVDKEIISKMKFPIGKPCQVVEKTDKYTIILFQTGNCRLMGCRKPIKSKEVKYNVKNLQLQSVTVVYNMNMSVNLNEISKLIKCWYEPEIFPGLRISK